MIVNPSNYSRLEEYAQAYYEIRQRKGVTLNDARKRVLEPNIFGPMMVKMGDMVMNTVGFTHHCTSGDTSCRGEGTG